MDDLIRRKDALEAIDPPYVCDDGHWWYESRIEEVPAVEGKLVKRGSWVNASGGRTICNQCGEYPLYDYWGRQKFSNFCPNCGAELSTDGLFD